MNARFSVRVQQWWGHNIVNGCVFECEEAFTSMAGISGIINGLRLGHPIMMSDNGSFS